ncbi:hypothetical protein OH77DRAFT_1593839 [Trametes cingulata]|nr:hypothetical protein OH77DRAFT_1593839 [Trametes cingulata]
MSPSLESTQLIAAHHVLRPVRPRGCAHRDTPASLSSIKPVVCTTCDASRNNGNGSPPVSAPTPSRASSQAQSDMSAPTEPLGALALSTLNGDVLSEVASYIRGRDALNLALTARRVHDFSVHRVAVALVCRTRADLVALHYHLLNGQPKRAVFLRSLTILGSTFVERPWQEDPNWISPKSTYEYSLASLVGDILEAAPNLTHLLLEHTAPLLQHDPRIGSAIASMTRIVRLELCDIGSNALPVFSYLRSRPRVLHISPIKVESSTEAKRVSELVHDILASVASIKELHALDLDLKGFPGVPDLKVEHILLPQVRHLSVHWWHPQLDVAKTFPNLEVYEQHVNSTQLKRSPQQPLRRLSVTELHAFECTRQPVHLLHLRRYPRELRSFRRTVYETSPVGISFHCFIDTAIWLKYWQQLPRAAPRLRFMDIHCHTWERRHEPGWVDQFVQSLRRYSLVCLRIVAPQPPTPDSLDAPWHEDDVQALAELPDRIVQVVSSLRYIAWAAKRRAPGGHVDDYTWYEDAYDCAPAEYKWYRVEESEGGRTLRTISASQGERVRRFLLDSDLDAITNIDENLRL